MAGSVGIQTERMKSILLLSCCYRSAFLRIITRGTVRQAKKQSRKGELRETNACLDRNP